MTERRYDESTPPDPCPPWCTRRHRSADHPEDLLHQSRPAYVEAVTGSPWLSPEGDPEALTLVARLVREPGRDQTWLEVVAEEQAALGLSVTAESARRLVGALDDLLALAQA